MNAIETDRLTRRFGNRVAVDQLAFSVAAGEVFGFLGPNGAGKTTTIKMLTCQMQPSAGTARVLGHDVRRAAAKIKPLIGVVFEEQNLYERMSGRENLAFYAQLYGTNQERVATVLDVVGLAPRARERVAKYSNGMRQRLLIARALLHQPAILFLDEPTHALDPSSARDMRALIASLRERSVTVFLTTHDMDEADRLCDRVAIIDRGKIVALDAPRALRLAYGERKVRVLRRDGGEEVLSLDPSPATDRLSAMLSRGEVIAIHSQEASLEDAFLALTGRRLVE